jgi:hypothetical protein
MWKFHYFYPIFKVLGCVVWGMTCEFVPQLREAGDELRVSHDDDVICRAIEKAEELDTESGRQTAELLRVMTDLEA